MLVRFLFLCGVLGLALLLLGCASSEARLQHWFEQKNAERDVNQLLW
jgi:hypothetical protein